MTLFAIPDALECLQRVRAAFRSYLPGTDAWLPVNNIGPTAKVIGGSASELFERIDYVGQQAFVLYAEGQYLEDHGADYGITRRLAAPSGGNLTLTASDAVAVDNGAQLLRSDGVVMAATASVSTSGGTLTIPVIATTSAAATNSQPGTPFTALSGVSGPGASMATIVADVNGILGGLDVEPDGLKRTTDLGTLRGRILFRKRNPPHGGAPADYVQWATEVAGVTRVYVERRWHGPGTVRVFPLFDDLFAGGVPDAAHVSLVADHIASLEPAAAEVTVAAATPYPIEVDVSGITPNTTAVINAVRSELLDTFRRLGQVAGSNTPVASLPFLATPFSFSALWVDQAIANATGNKRAIVTAPASDVILPAGAVPVLSFAYP